MIQTDEEIMLMVKENKDELAFERLVQRHRKSILNFVYRFTGDQEISEDLSQDVFLRLWSSADTYLPIAKFTTFLFTIAKNLCLNMIAKTKSLPEIQPLDGTSDNIADLNDSPETALIDKETISMVKGAIGKLSPEHRLVFVLTEYHGLSYQEVAEIAQCPVGTVASRKNAAVKLLKQRLSPFIA